MFLFFPRQMPFSVYVSKGPDFSITVYQHQSHLLLLRNSQCLSKFNENINKICADIHVEAFSISVLVTPATHYKFLHLKYETAE
jgi:hypothetical protein